jgi:hypothetical protein
MISDVTAVGLVEFETPVSFTLVKAPAGVIMNFAEFVAVVVPLLFLSVDMIVKYAFEPE